MGPTFKDADWVRHAFLVSVDRLGNVNLEDVDSQNRSFSSASLKYTDTTPGGNFAINPPPQFTRTADPRVEGRFSGHSDPKNDGMGRYYSEAIDDNSQIIHMRFGQPAFNSLTTFFTGFYNTGAGQLARTGRSGGAFYELGRAVGFVVSIMSWKLLAVQLLGVGLRFALNKPSSKFYYLRPAMPLYWNAVTTIVNQIAVNRGIVPRIGGPDGQKLNEGYEFDDIARQRLNEMLPEIFKFGGGVDIYAMATRGQRLARRHNKAMEQALNSATDMQLSRNMGDYSALIQANSGKIEDPGSKGLHAYLETWFKAPESVPNPDGTDGTPNSTTEAIGEKSPAWWEYQEAEFDDGGSFASFRVNSTGPISESFSSTVGESELAGKLNSMSSSSRETSFSFAGGNVAGDSAIGAIAQGALGAAKNFITGVGDSLAISGLAMLGGAAFVDIPKHWVSSVASLPKANYTIHLVSPYGNPISQLINLHIPLAMLLAGALPLSTGKQSYTSPFLVELYDQGRCQTRLGMIDSMTITRGTGNLGFNNQGHALGIDVTFSVIDMSSVMHMPISEGFSLGTAIAAGAAAAIGTEQAGKIGKGLITAVGAFFDEDTVFTDYMAVLSGLGLADQIYATHKAKLNLTRELATWDSWASITHFASFLGDTVPGRLAGAFYAGTARGN